MDEPRQHDRRFRVGELITTEAAQKALDDVDLHPGFFLASYVQLDFGSIDEAQRAANERAIKDRRGEIKGIYKTVLGVELWLVTDKGWRTTFVMLPCEYAEAMAANEGATNGGANQND